MPVFRPHDFPLKGLERHNIDLKDTLLADPFVDLGIGYHLLGFDPNRLLDRLLFAGSGPTLVTDFLRFPGQRLFLHPLQGQARLQPILLLAFARTVGLPLQPGVL